MCLIKTIYKKLLIHRYDKDGIIPYLSASDFPGLLCEERTFVNSRDVNIHYYFYNYADYKKDKLILFLPGIGPGHTAYIAEINALCSRGYKVLTLDYMGCDKSEGESSISFNEPTRDVDDLLNYLNIEKNLIVVGHSLGGYTGLNIINLKHSITKAIIISGFLSIELQLQQWTKSNFLRKRILSIERKADDKYFGIDNLNYLRNTTDKLLFIQSNDDQVVSFANSLKIVREIHNPNIQTIEEAGKKHNPNYKLEAVNYMNEVFGTYNYLVKHRKLKTLEEKQKYMEDKSALRMTEQDEKIISRIIEFIEEGN